MADPCVCDLVFGGREDRPADGQQSLELSLVLGNVLALVREEEAEEGAELGTK